MKQNLDIVRNKDNHSITITPPNPTSSLIWMHGLGDSSEGYFNYFLQDESPLYNGTRIVLLQAPIRAMTINGGNKCNSWYDIKAFGPGLKQEERISYDDIKDSYNKIQAAVDFESKFWETLASKIAPNRRIFLGGFSQGSSMSLFYGLQCPKPLLGLICLSGLLFQPILMKNLQHTKALIYHGNADKIIPLQFAQLSYARQNFYENPNVKINVVDNLDHSTSNEQLKEVNKWMKQLIAQQLNI